VVGWFFWDAGDPWPEQLPPFKGVAILKHNGTRGDYGHGLEIRKQFYSDWEAHPDPTNYPNLYRAKVKILFESIPADAAEKFKAQVGKHAVVERVFQVDRQRKVFLMIGANAVRDETTTADKDAFRYEDTPLAEPAGSWQWHKARADNIFQYVLNANNKVLRETNYGNPNVIKTGDWSMNCKFNLAQPHVNSKDVLCAEISPSPPDETDAQLKDIIEYFTAADDMFRSPVEKSKHTVYVLVEFVKVTEIDTPQERFGGTLQITLTWKITKEDVVEYVAAPDRDDWKPKFTPPVFEVDNPASGDGAALIRTKFSSTTLVKKKTGYMARQVMTVSGDFWEPFELQNYPFDVQPLGIVLKTTTAMADVVKFVVTIADLPKIRDTEWKGMGSAATCKFELEEGKKKRGNYVLTAEADTARYYAVHM
jgi:hypothetical protein